MTLSLSRSVPGREPACTSQSSCRGSRCLRSSPKGGKFQNVELEKESYTKTVPHDGGHPTIPTFPKEGIQAVRRGAENSPVGMLYKSDHLCTRSSPLHPAVQSVW